MVDRSISDFEPVWVWGLPLLPVTLEQSLDLIDKLIERREPSYIITPNLNYVMLTERRPELAAVNAGAAFMLADGMPLVKQSRRMGTPLPCRVTGSDLIWKLFERAGQRGYRIYLLGGEPGVADEAARRMTAKHPDLVIAGIESPPFRPLTPDEQQQQRDRIRAARPDILIVSFGQPKGELWVAEHCAKLGVPFNIQLGASIDFVAGRVYRAPRWVQKIGMEWFFRMAQEPRRLAGRYIRNGWFLIRKRVSRPKHRP